MKVYNLYLYSDSANLGDYASSPLNYFDFPFDTAKRNMGEWPKYKDDIKDKVVIIGGGGHFHLPTLDYANGRMMSLEEIKATASHVIGWGIGSNIHEEKEVIYPGNCTDGFLLLGVRDQAQGMEWVPCASCMDKVFHFRYKASEDVVIFEHPGEQIPVDAPRICAAGKDYKKAIEFIAKGKTVITNSYHGAYWGILLGRKVVVYKPFSSKFYAIHPNVVFTDGSDVAAKIKMAKTDRSFLNKCRTANKIFYEKVVKTIEEIG